MDAGPGAAVGMGTMRGEGCVAQSVPHFLRDNPSTNPNGRKIQANPETFNQYLGLHPKP